MQVEVAQTVSQGGWSQNYLQVVLDSQNDFLINVGSGSMLFRSTVNGVVDQTVIGYDPTALPYWRIRHEQTANTVSFETSTNGVNWTTRKTVTAGFSLTAVRFYLMAGAWGTGNGSPGAAKYDNFQLAESGAPPAPVTNLALNKPATQISEGWGGAASRAVDGNTNGNFNGNSVTHTATGTQDWWQVDLGSSYALETIKVWNRTDCCGERLSNFYVFVSDQPFTSYDLNTTLSQAGVSNYYTAGQGGTPTYINVNRTGRYVRVQLSTAGMPLSLAEVEVMGSTVALANINWLVTDQLGTPRMIFDKTGALANVKRHDYLPFGEELMASQGLRTALPGNTPFGYGASDGVRQKFTQKERDNETGLDYFGARYFASTQGRFTSADPLLTSATVESPQSWNRYDYALNKPLKYIDPTGMWNWDASAGGPASDQDLLDKWHNKSLKSKERNEAERQYKFRQTVKAGLDSVGAAANSPTLTADQQSQVRSARESYGSENDNNGVLVGIKKAGGPATTGLNDDGTITVLFRDNDKNANSFAANIAHEGQHVEDAQAFLANPYVGSPLDLTHYEREMRAYDTGAYTAEGLGMKGYPAHSDLKAWQSGWKEAERVTRIANYVRAGYPNSPGPENPGPRYSEEYKGVVRWVP